MRLLTLGVEASIFVVCIILAARWEKKVGVAVGGICVTIFLFVFDTFELVSLLDKTRKRRQAPRPLVGCLELVAVGASAIALVFFMLSDLNFEGYHRAPRQWEHLQNICVFLLSANMYVRLPDIEAV
ncbi:hypothetical protein AK830_g7306 [Neonectria ditissima]|uniref:Uncharacterized protein n=1 Tax=Neonectria ditissima TaxID=78410 RepID=A0A0P7AZY7_9HYPO|nr:hypothetical protein AK830_g7306 [Neonectria ditissima]